MEKKVKQNCVMLTLTLEQGGRLTPYKPSIGITNAQLDNSMPAALVILRIKLFLINIFKF
ncbi:MAG: hypothetical protein KAR06_13000 [Deltaproteobacteria bacterium]|nr:hypothetical protein [Deltaproteobacteria bacterium]